MQWFRVLPFKSLACIFRLLFFFNFFLTFIYFWDRDRAWTGEGQREGDTESETGSGLWAVSTEPDAGLKLTDREIMTWAEVGRLTDRATQVPLYYFFKKCLWLFLREREHKQGRGKERGRYRIWSPLQVLSCQLRVQSMRGSNSQTEIGRASCRERV